MVDAGRIARHLCRPVERGRRAPESGPVRELRRDHQISLVLVRDEGGRQARNSPHAGCRQNKADDHHQPAATDHAADQPGIGVFRFRIDPVKAAIKHVALLRRDRRAQPQRALRRLQRGGVDRADQRGCRDHQGKLWEHLAAQPGHEGRRQEHRHQHQRDADDRPEQLAHRLDRGVVARHALFDVFRDPLDDDDRVVDDDADRQDQREQGRQVDRESERRHAGEGADDRDRHRRRRHQRCAQVLQEDQDDNEHQHAGLPQRLVDLVDRVLDEDRRIVRDAVGQAGRKAARQLLHFRRHDLGHGQRVASGL